MPHLVILYTGNLEARTDMGVLCRSLADTMLTLADDDGEQVFPTGGTRVLAYPAAHHAVADAESAQCDFGFIYLNLRMGRGRSEATKGRIGAALAATVRAHVAALLDRSHVGVTLQIDEGGEVFDAKLGNLHPLFNPPT